MIVINQYKAVGVSKAISPVAGMGILPATTAKEMLHIVSSILLARNIKQVNSIVEKREPEVAPSILAVVGRYILTPHIFHHLQNVKAGAGGEIRLTDGIAALMNEIQLLTYRFNGIRYDCCSKFGYLQAQVAFGLKHPEVRDGLMSNLAQAVRNVRQG